MKPTGLLVVSQIRDSGAGRELPPNLKSLSWPDSPRRSLRIDHEKRSPT